MLHESPPTATDREAAVEAALAGLAEDDATALLTGTWGPDQAAQATVRVGAMA